MGRNNANTKRADSLSGFKYFYEELEKKRPHWLSRDYMERQGNVDNSDFNRRDYYMGHIIQLNKITGVATLPYRLLVKRVKKLAKSIKGIDFSNIFIYNAYCSIHKQRKDKKNMSKNDKKPKTKTATTAGKNNETSTKSGIMGVGMSLVIVSIAYSTAVIALGTKGVTPLVMIAPQALFAGGVLLYAFTKIFK